MFFLFSKGPTVVCHWAVTVVVESRARSAPPPRSGSGPGGTLVLILIECEGSAAGLCCSPTPRLFI